MTDETQVATPIEDAPPSPEVEAADSSPAVESEAATPEKADESGRDKVQKRFDQLTWEREQARREAEYYRNLALQAQPEPPKPEAPKLPTLEEHGYDEAKYQAALIQYATSQAEKVVEARLSQAEQQRAEQSRLASFAERQREFAKATPDFESKVLRDPTLPISETMRDVIVDSPNGPEMAYYLASNRDVAEQIARLPPHLAALEMGRIEGRLSQKAKPPQVSKAPPPPPRIEETSTPMAGVKSSDPESDKLSDAEWMRLRNKELKRRKS